MKQLSATLTLDVTYDVPDHLMIAPAHFTILNLLKSIVTRAADNGLISGDTELTVNVWTSNVIVHDYKPKEQ